MTEIREGSVPALAGRRRRRVCALLLAPAVALTFSAAVAVAGRTSATQAKEHFACDQPNSAHVPCRFSTPSGNVHCLWTPSPNTVTCELVARARTYRLRPHGKSSSIQLNLPRRGETLPMNQQLTLPNSLSCHDTRTSMTCNQDFGSGAFKLSPQGSHHS
jgi:hypothetical protein